MKLKLSKVELSIPSFQEIKNKDIPIVISLKIARLLKKLDEENALLQEQKQNLYKKYGEDDGNGNIKVKEENIQQFMEEINILFNQEVEIEFEKLDYNEMKIDISPDKILPIEEFFI